MPGSWTASRKRAQAASRYDYLYLEGLRQENSESQDGTISSSHLIPIEPLARFIRMTDAYRVYRHCQSQQLLIALPHGGRTLRYYLQSYATRCRLKALYYRTYGVPLFQATYAQGLEHLIGRALAEKPCSDERIGVAGEEMAVKWGLPAYDA